MTEIQRLVWVLSTPECVKINSAVQELTGVAYATSDQNKEATAARLARDTSGTQQLLKYLSQRNPFSMDPFLRNVATRFTAHTNVNAHNAKTIGEQILVSMEGKFTDYPFKGSHQAITMEVKASVMIRDEKVPTIRFSVALSALCYCWCQLLWSI